MPLISHLSFGPVTTLLPAGSHPSPEARTGRARHRAAESGGRNEPCRTTPTQSAPPSARTPDLSWAPIPKSRAHELVIEAIEEQVMSGRLSVGDTLPPERELASMLQVSRAGVREAIRMLESHGALESRVGAGSSSGTIITAMPSTALTRLLRLHIGLSNFPVGDVVELRIALDRTSAGLASKNADDAAASTG